MGYDLIYEKGHFYNGRGYRIHYKIWKPKSAKIKHVAMIVHGLGEHSGRYWELADLLGKLGFISYSMDFYGFGLSEGKRGHVKSIQDYIKDLKTLYNIAGDNAKNAGLKGERLIFGHSMGGLLTLSYIEEYPRDFNMAIISAPALNPGRRATPIQYAMGSLFKIIFPSLVMSHGLRPDEITTDEKEQENLKRDELVHDKISVRLFFDMLKASAEVKERYKDINSGIKILFLHGEEDPIALKQDTEKFFYLLDVKDKELRIIPGMKHEVLTDKNKSVTFKIIEDWILKRVKNPER